jgi:hypothetical protein
VQGALRSPSPLPVVGAVVSPPLVGPAWVTVAEPVHADAANANADNMIINRRNVIPPVAIWPR